MKQYLKNSTAKAFIFSNLISCPFFGIFALLPMILCKELKASPVQISTMTALKPLSALFAVYWISSRFSQRHCLCLIWAYFLKFLPFIFAPFFSNPWVFIGAFGMHMLLLRGVIPTWMELLRLGLSEKDRGKICALGSILNYLCTAFIPLIFGWILDEITGSWRWIFCTTSLLGMGCIAIIFKMFWTSKKHEPIVTTNLRKSFSKPWQEAKRLLLKRSDFFHFQIGFFLGGAGLMTIHAAIPKYFTESLSLSYTEIFLAICFCKGIGFTVASPLWIRMFNRLEIFSFCACVPLLAVVFPILLILAKLHLYFAFFAYFLYGVMQAGSELGWKMSGLVFSGKEDSSPYSLINVLTVGIRGGTFPYLGAFLFICSGAYLTFTMGGILCLMGSFYLWRYRKKYTLLLNES